MEAAENDITNAGDDLKRAMRAFYEAIAELEGHAFARSNLVALTAQVLMEGNRHGDAVAIEGTNLGQSTSMYISSNTTRTARDFAKKWETIYRITLPKPTGITELEGVDDTTVTFSVNIVPGPRLAATTPVPSSCTSGTKRQPEDELSPEDEVGPKRTRMLRGSPRLDEALADLELGQWMATRMGGSPELGTPEMQTPETKLRPYVMPKGGKTLADRAKSLRKRSGLILPSIEELAE